MLVINLVQLRNVQGIYPLLPSGAANPHGVLPDRLARLHPEAARAFPGVRCSDMYRDPAGSIAAIRSKAGVKRPGYSGHNFGLSIDVAVDLELKQRRWTKQQLDAWLAASGWYCHRRDGARGNEDWHYNFLLPEALAKCGPLSTERGIEYMINRYYTFTMNQFEIQTALKNLEIYSGAIDSTIGPKSKLAIAQFKQEWGLPIDGGIDDRFIRTLAMVSAKVVVNE